jgi:hypothetical protein
MSNSSLCLYVPATYLPDRRRQEVTHPDAQSYIPSRFPDLPYQKSILPASALLISRYCAKSYPLIRGHAYDVVCLPASLPACLAGLQSPIESR